MGNSWMYLLLMFFGSMASFRMAKYYVTEKSSEFFESDWASVFLVFMAEMYIAGDSFSHFGIHDGRLSASLFVMCFFFVAGLLAARDDRSMVISHSGRRYRHQSMLDIERAYCCARTAPGSIFVFALGLAMFILLPGPSYFTGILQRVVSEISGDTRTYNDKHVTQYSYTKMLAEMEHDDASHLAKDLDLSKSQIEKLHALRRDPFTDNQS